MQNHADPSDFGDFYSPEIAAGRDDRPLDDLSNSAWDEHKTHLCDEHALLGILLLKHDYLLAGNTAMVEEMERRAAKMRRLMAAV